MYIRVHPRDNVAILVHPEGAAAGALLPGGLVARERIPQSHKVALQDVAQGAPIVRYGQTIGLANRAIAAGAWVREEMLDMPAAPPLDALPLATAVPDGLAAARRATRSKATAMPDGGTGTQEHSRARHHRAMRRAHRGVRGAADSRGTAAALSECGWRGGGDALLWLRRGHRCARRGGADPHVAAYRPARRISERSPWS